MGTNNYTTKTCIDCGAVMENCGAARKRCPECVKIWARIQSANRKVLQRERARLGMVISKTVSTVSNDYCKDCICYFGDSENNKCCNYIFIHGTKRPCPPGKDCTVKEKKKNSS